MTVRKILNLKGADVVTIAPDKKLLDAIELLAKHRIGALIVTGSSHEVAGVISERDIVRLLSNKDNNRFENTVASAMTKPVKSCKPEDTIQHVMQVMTAGRFRHMPVVENGKLAGIVSIGDVVKLRLEEIERESEHLKEYIAMA